MVHFIATDTIGNLNQQSTLNVTFQVSKREYVITQRSNLDTTHVCDCNSQSNHFLLFTKARVWCSSLLTRADYITIIMSEQDL